MSRFYFSEFQQIRCDERRAVKVAARMSEAGSLEPWPDTTARGGIYRYLRVYSMNAKVTKNTLSIAASEERPTNLASIPAVTIPHRIDYEDIAPVQNVWSQRVSLGAGETITLSMLAMPYGSGLDPLDLLTDQRPVLFTVRNVSDGYGVVGVGDAIAPNVQISLTPGSLSHHAASAAGRVFGQGFDRIDLEAAPGPVAFDIVIATRPDDGIFMDRPARQGSPE